MTGKSKTYKGDTMGKFVFGITGGTGAGKSTVSELFAKLGVKIIDADKVSRIVTNNGMPCLEALTDVFGEDILDSERSLDRRKLAQIAFSDSEQLSKLTAITHKYIKEFIENEIDNSACRLIAIDGAVIIGSPVMNLCKKLVVVTADENIRFERIMKRDNISEQSAKQRISAQMSDEEYLTYADYAIVNNGDFEKIGAEIERIYSEIKDISKAEGTKS